MHIFIFCVRLVALVCVGVGRGASGGAGASRGRFGAVVRRSVRGAPVLGGRRARPGRAAAALPRRRRAGAALEARLPAAPPAHGYRPAGHRTVLLIYCRELALTKFT